MYSGDIDEVGVVFVPTAGARKRVLIDGKEAPAWLYWPVLKWFLDVLRRQGHEVGIQLLSDLKPETEDRVLRAIEVCRKESSISYVVFAGGASHRNPPIAASMAELFSRTIGNDWAGHIVIDTESVQTAGNARFGIQSLMAHEDLPGDRMRVRIVTSWYHLPRVHRELRCTLPSKARIEWRAVLPRLTWECLAHEYFFNVLTEPLKLLVSYFPALLAWYEKKERKSRRL